MKEIEVIDKVIEKLERVYAYSTEDIVRDSNKCRCDVIVNYPGTSFTAGFSTLCFKGTTGFPKPDLKETGSANCRRMTIS